jgi:hypothetical protein
MSKFIWLLLIALIFLGVSQPKPVYANGQSTEEVIIIELEIENILGVQRIEVPINKNPLGGGKGKGGGGSYNDKPGSYIYSLDTQELSKRKVRVHFTASFDSHNSIEKDFVVVRGKKSKYKFKHGVSIVAYYGRATPNNSFNRSGISLPVIR